MIQAQTNPPQLVGKELARFSRPQNVVVPGMIAAFAAHHAGGSVWSYFLVYVLVVLLYCVAAGANNIQDTAIDTRNGRRDNPLAGGRLNIQQARWFLLIIALLVLLLQLFLAQPATLILSMLYLALAISYSHPRTNLQSRGFAATACLAVCYGAFPVFLGAVQGNISVSQASIPAGMTALLLAPLLLAKDYKDLAGDRQFGKRTPLVRYGKTGVIIAAGLLTAIAAGVVIFVGISSAQWILIPLACVYITFVAYVHLRSARYGMVAARLLQLTLLGIVWLLLASYL